MHVQVKMITGIWQNDKDYSPLQFQFVADPLKPWRIQALNELHASIVNLHPAKVVCNGYEASPEDILACSTWEQVAGLFYPIRLILNRDEDKHFTLTFSDKDERFHLYIQNY